MKNFLITITRFKMATALNIVGLSVAFAAFVIIMMQVRWEYGYGITDKAADSLYRFEVYDQVRGYYNMNNMYGVCEAVVSDAPEVVDYAMVLFTTQLIEVNRDGQKVFFKQMPVLFTNNDLSKLFDVEMQMGVMKDLLAPNMAIVSSSTALKMFGDKDPIGMQIKMFDDLITICGVYKDMPDNAIVTNGVIMFDPYGKRGVKTLFVKVDNKKNADKIIANFKKKESNVGGYGQQIPSKMSVRLNPVKELYFAADVSDNTFIEKGDKTTTNILLLVAILVVVIAAINFVNFYMALAPTRVKGLNTRLVFGSTRSQLRWRIIFEGGAIAIAGFLVALMLVDMLNYTSMRELVKINSTQISEHWGVITSCFFMAIGVGAVAGVFPSLYCTNFEPALALKGSGVGTKSGKIVRTGLVGVQFVISTSLIICALFVSLQHKAMLNAPLGFDPENLLTVDMGSNAFAKQLQEELKKMPSVSGSATFNGAFGVYECDMTSEAVTISGDTVELRSYFVDYNFLKLLGIPIIEGENFDETATDYWDDYQNNRVPNIIINQTGAKLFGAQVGQKMGCDGNGANVIGITDDFVSQSIAVDQGAAAFVIYKENQSVIIKIDAANTKNSIDKINEAIKIINPNNPPTVGFYHEYIEHLYNKEKQFGELITMFSTLAIILSLIGVFGLVFFDTQAKRKEIGIRKVFGSTVKEVLVLFNVRYIKILALCFVVAVPIGYVVVWEWLQGFAYKTPLYYWVAIVAVATVAIITIIIVTLQTLNAANENPVKSIKSE